MENNGMTTISYIDLVIKCSMCGEIHTEYYTDNEDALKETHATCPFCGRTGRLE
jgi:Zn finger protein HypA/HybF involved in hydrogenase expression